MTDLIARLEAAEAGSLDLSKAVMLSFGFTWRGLNYWNDADEIWRGSGAVTESIDAAKALASRVLPEARWVLVQQDAGWGAMPLLFDGTAWDSPNDPGETVARSLPLAICAAILRAKGSDQ